MRADEFVTVNFTGIEMLEDPGVTNPFSASLTRGPIVCSDAVVVDGIEKLRSHGDTLMGFLGAIAPYLSRRGLLSLCRRREKESTKCYCEGEIR